MTKLFRKDDDGLLHEVAEANARSSGLFRRVVIGSIDVLLTDAEMAERKADEERAIAKRAQREKDEADKAARKQAVLEKLNLSSDEIELFKG